MAKIEYCDNNNCMHNDNFQCMAEEVEFDKNAICVTARYEGDSNDGKGDPKTKDDWSKDLTGNKKDKWIKYI